MFSNFKHFFSTFENYDVFYCTDPVEPYTSKQIVELYKPVTYIEEAVQSKYEGKFGTNLYGKMLSNELKKRYEIQNEFRYDIVISTKFGLDYFNSKFPNTAIYPRTIYSVGRSNDNIPTDFEHHSINDMLIWGDSPSMDIVTNTYRHYKFKCLAKDITMRNGMNDDPGEIYYSIGALLYNRAIANNVTHERVVL
jgi:hypothetical protein